MGARGCAPSQGDTRTQHGRDRRLAVPVPMDHTVDGAGWDVASRDPRFYVSPFPGSLFFNGVSVTQGLRSTSSGAVILGPSGRFPSRATSHTLPWAGKSLPFMQDG